MLIAYTKIAHRLSFVMRNISKKFGDKVNFLGFVACIVLISVVHVGLKKYLSEHWKDFFQDCSDPLSKHIFTKYCTPA